MRLLIATVLTFILASSVFAKGQEIYKHNKPQQEKTETNKEEK